MKTKPLTKRQRMVLGYINRLTRQQGFGPTIREIAQEMGIRSPNGVVVHLNALERKGYIRRSAKMSRSIKLVDGGAGKPLRGLPLVGDVAAGALNEAIEQRERLDLERLFQKPGQFALRVKGDSMIDAHIADGDYVIVQKQPTAAKGQIVVALTSDGEATIKYYFPEKKRVRLQPANKKMKPIISADVSIVGIVVGVIRNLKPV